MQLIQTSIRHNETVNTGTNHANGNEGHKVELADDVADKITGMEEVKSANVFVTDNNAYVAVDLKEGSKRERRIGRRKLQMKLEQQTENLTMYT